MTTLFFITLCIIWGTTWMAIKINLSAFPPFYSAGLRFLLAGIILFLMGKITKRTFKGDFRDYIPSIVFGMLNGVTYGLVYWGEQFISSGMTAILNASLPFFSMIFAALFVGETITLRKIAGLVIGFCGVLLLFVDGLSTFHMNKLWGQLSIIFSAIVYALAGVYMKKRSAVNPFEAVMIQMFCSALILLAVALPVEDLNNISFSVPTVAAFLYLSFVGSALAFYLYNQLILRMEVSQLSYVSMITPGIATAVGVLFLGEQVYWRTAAGMTLILMGTAVINLTGRKREGTCAETKFKSS